MFLLKATRKVNYLFWYLNLNIYKAFNKYYQEKFLKTITFFNILSLSYIKL